MKDYYFVVASITIIAYAVSPVFRSSKRKEWSGNPARKFWDLGISSICLVSLIGFLAWLALRSSNPTNPQQTIQVVEGDEGGVVRLNVTTKTRGIVSNEVTIAVKKGGLKKMLNTGSIHELGNAIRENVTVVQPATNSNR